MAQQEKEAIHQAVRARYGAIAESGTATAAATSAAATTAAAATTSEPCCSPLEDYAVDLSSIPVNAGQLALGCGDPITLAELRPGETVLDLGSGAGMDCFLAAERVGERGRVIGVDMTEAMIARAEANRRQAGLDNVEFRLGQIESLPVDDASVDVIISNCVINLSPDKQAVLDEAFRVLRPGGRFSVADMVTLGYFGPEAQANLDAWSCCVSGAAEVNDLAAALGRAGFTAVSIRDKAAPDVELVGGHALSAGPRLISARIQAAKPG